MNWILIVVTFGGFSQSSNIVTGLSEESCKRMYNSIIEVNKDFEKDFKNLQIRAYCKAT